MVLPHDEPEPRRRFTADEVMQMVRAGILDADERVELIDGELLQMSPQDPPHAHTVERLDQRLHQAYATGFRVRAQLPLQLSIHDVPEPDFVIARGDLETFARRHPDGSDTVLVIEVSDSTRRRDLRKVALYAAYGVSCYWRIDLETRRVEVYTKPTSRGYAEVAMLAHGDEVSLPETSERWRVADLLPAT